MTQRTVEMALHEPALKAAVVEDMVAPDVVDRLQWIDCFEADCAV